MLTETVGGGSCGRDSGWAVAAMVETVVVCRYSRDSGKFSFTVGPLSR